MQRANRNTKKNPEGIAKFNKMDSPNIGVSWDEDRSPIKGPCWAAESAELDVWQQAKLDGVLESLLNHLD